MDHNMIVRDSPEVPFRPFFASCSCGPQGNFASKDEAIQFLHAHAGHVGTGVNTVSFKDITGQEPEKPPEEPDEGEEKENGEEKKEGEGQGKVKPIRKVRR
jgi:hypothetical protein